MKMKINKVMIIFLAVLALSATVSAQSTKGRYSDAVLEKALKVFPVSLESDYQGIVESTIYNIIILKSYFPDADYRKLLDRLNEVAKENTDASIRYKAHLASMYLTLRNNIQITPAHQNDDHENVFRQIADQLEKKLLVSNE